MTETSQPEPVAQPTADIEPNPANRGIRTRHAVEYLYPGSLFPESITKRIEQPTLDAVIAAQPDEEGYFQRDGWYAATISAIEEKRYEAADGDETWMRLSSNKGDSWVVGERVPLTDPRIDSDSSGALRSNLTQYATLGGPGGKTSDGVLTRRGTWQPAAVYGHVITDAEAKGA